ncbi:monocyte to macrophage differentiation factor-like [Clytia hemisphaerica]|uniref:monocyte to macrophage differentiation factor-like n=1 Tax=Clytia hemisphaerica TaxID=252671 RepID=UPI0034D605D3|eukprot:TCONS_00015331-protein
MVDSSSDNKILGKLSSAGWICDQRKEQWRKDGYMNCCGCKGQAYNPTDVEQKANIITHGINIPFAVVAVYFMVIKSKDNLDLVCTLVYGTSLLMLFTVSTLFHVISLLPKWRESRLRKIFHLCDRFSIYIFISASYMPWLLLQRTIPNAHDIVTLLWSIAAMGIVYSLVMHEKYKMLETAIYLCQGFGPAIFLIKHASTSLFELALGGLLYVIGVIFFKSDGHLPFAHAIWHILGSIAAWVHHYGIWMYFYAG